MCAKIQYRRQRSLRVEASAKQKKLLSSIYDMVVVHGVRKKRSSHPSSLSLSPDSTLEQRKDTSSAEKAIKWIIRANPPLPNLKPNQQVICGVK
jgi:hypothetical protein